MTTREMQQIRAKRKTGTREWADFNANIDLGCKNGCRYCYACANALRFRRIKDREDWIHPRRSGNWEFKKPRKLAGRIMFPTTHDIYHENVDRCVMFLKKWLSVGNDVLIVTKPSEKAMMVLLEELNNPDEWKKQITFRFTIGSSDEEAIKFWEPYAPSFNERIRCLIETFRAGFRTSVSMEPYYDDTVIPTAQLLLPYVSDSLWIGKMNFINQRVDWKHLDVDEEVWKHWKMKVEHVSTDEWVRAIYHAFQFHEKVKWKDSIKKVLNLPEEKIG